MAEYIAKPTSRMKIRNFANGIREYLEWYDEKYFPVVEFLELVIPQLEPDFSYEIVPVEEMKHQYGLTYPDKKLICLREDVYEKAAEGTARDRFTIAHEIGHYFMHRPGELVLARNQNKEKIPAYQDPEWQANTFAGELLAPPQIITGLTAKEISLCCGVSLDVAKIQLKNI
jgi:Zn-dependent peptidase ImmA (M78 family)